MYAKPGRIAAGVVVIAAVTGCMTTTKIESRRAAPFAQPITELFVVSGVGEDRETDPAKFEAEMQRYGRECHLRLGITTKNSLDLDPGVHERRMKAFGARYLLTVTLTGGTKRADGARVMASYDARLGEASSTQLLLRATVQLYFRLGGEASYTLARDLMRELEANGALAPCPSLHAPTSDETPHRE